MGWGAGTGQRSGRSYPHEGVNIEFVKKEHAPAGPVKITKPDGTVIVRSPLSKEEVREMTDHRNPERPLRSITMDEMELIKKNRLKFSGDQASMEMWYKMQLRARSRRQRKVRRAGMDNPGPNTEGAISLLEVD